MLNINIVSSFLSNITEVMWVLINEKILFPKWVYSAIYWVGLAIITQLVLKRTHCNEHDYILAVQCLFTGKSTLVFSAEVPLWCVCSQVGVFLGICPISHCWVKLTSLLDFESLIESHVSQKGNVGTRLLLPQRWDCRFLSALLVSQKNAGCCPSSHLLFRPMCFLSSKNVFFC